MPLIHVDVSDHQAATFSDLYSRRFAMFRIASEWDRPDAKAAANLAWCVKARAAGKLVNFGVYALPGNIPNDAVVGRLAALNVPTDCVVMLDVESWGGLIKGDHSGQFNTLAETLRARQRGRADLIWGYLNPNVDADLWPKRPAWLGFIQPAYGHPDPPDPKGLNRIGWQYCNAVQNGTNYPSSSAPFGRCDHNVMFTDYPGVQVTQPTEWTQESWNLLLQKLANIPVSPTILANPADDWTRPLSVALGNLNALAFGDKPLAAAYPLARAADLAVIEGKVDALIAAVAALQTGGPVSFDMAGTLTPKATP